MSFKEQNNKEYEGYKPEELEGKILKLYQELREDKETEDCCINCIAIALGLDNDAYIRGVINRKAYNGPSGITNL